MWSRGVERALAAWGPHVALLVARHGALIYRRYVLPRQMNDPDAAALRHFFAAEEANEAAWTRSLRIEPTEINRQTRWIAAADALSLALCGDLRAPLDLEIPGVRGEISARLSAIPHRPYEFTLSPWPFRVADLRRGRRTRAAARGAFHRRGGDARLAHGSQARAVPFPSVGGVRPTRLPNWRKI